MYNFSLCFLTFWKVTVPIQTSISSFEFSMYIHKWWLHCKRNNYLETYRGTFFYLRQIFFILCLLKSRKIAKFYMIRLLLQFSLGSRDFDVITSYICLLTKEIETGINNEKWTIFILFLTFKKMFAFFLYMKKRGFKLSIDSYIINFTIFFKPNFSSENHNFSGKSCLHGKVLIFKTFSKLNTFKFYSA